MTLIHKGGFRERANRQSKYQNSENRQANLKPQNQYQPNTESTQQPRQQDVLEQLHHFNPQDHGKAEK